MVTETLTCSHDGHTWERERKRGRKPTTCPEHRVVAEPVTSAPAESVAVDPIEDNPFLAGFKPDPMPVEERLELAREAKKDKQESERASLIRRAREANLDPEKRRIADYCIEQMDLGRQDGHLSGRLKEIVREHERRKR